MHHLLNGGTNTYQWDAEGRLIGVNDGSTWSATYNAFGQRVERMSSSSGRTEHLYGPGGVDMGNFNGGNGTWYEEYVQFDGRVLWYFSGGVSRYFHVNALGSLGLATDQTGAPVEEMLYYPFGSRWQNSAGFGWDEKFAQFPQRNDDIQKYQASFREYDPGLGRWMSPDRLAGNVMNPQSLDRYTYVLNDPVSNIDPLGLDPCPPGVSADVCVVGHTGVKGVAGQSDGPGPGTDRNPGTGGGSAPAGGPVPSYWQVLKSFNKCAANFADKHSLASVTHTNNVPVLGTLLGSTTAAASDLVFRTNPKEYVPAGANLAAGAKAGPLLKLAVVGVGKIPAGGNVYVSTGETVATPYGPAIDMASRGTTVADTAAGSTLLSGAKAFAETLDFIAKPLVLYDEIAYGVGEAVCTEQALGGP